VVMRRLRECGRKRRPNFKTMHGPLSGGKAAKPDAPVTRMRVTVCLG
jgi:hypothetical protein